MNTTLITVAEFVEFENLPFDNRDDIDDKMLTAIENAELDLQKILGSNLYFDVVKNQDELSYSDLMHGSEFEKNDYTYAHKGIKAVLSKYALSRYVYTINSNYTPFGLHQRDGENSSNVSYASIKEQSKQAQLDASDVFDMVQLYLEVNSRTFKAYKSNNSNGLDPLSNDFTFQLL